MIQNKENTHKLILSGSAISFLGIIIDQAGGLGFKFFLARLLSPEEFGLVTLAVVIFISVASFVQLGYDGGITRFIPLYNGRSEEDKVKTSMNLVLTIVLFTSLFLSITMFFLVEKISVILPNENLKNLIQVFIIGLPFFALSKILISGLRGMKQFSQMIIVDNIIWRIIPLVFFLILYFTLELRSLGAAIAYVIGTIFMLLTSWYFFFYGDLKKYPSGIYNKKNIYEITRYSLPLWFFFIFNTFKSKTDILLLGLFLDTAKIGIYGVAVMFASLIEIFLAAIRTVYNPIASEYWGKEKFDKIANIYSNSQNILIILTLPIALFMFFFSEECLNIFLGSSYIGAASVMSILSLCYFLKVAVGPVGATLLAIGKSQLTLKINILSAVITILSNFLLIPTMGILGAAIASGTSIVVQQLLMYYYVKKIIKINIFFKSQIIYTTICFVVIKIMKYYTALYITNIYFLLSVAFIYYIISILLLFIMKPVLFIELKRYFKKILKNYGYLQ